MAKVYASTSRLRVGKNEKGLFVDHATVDSLGAPKWDAIELYRDTVANELAKMLIEEVDRREAAAVRVKELEAALSNRDTNQHKRIEELEKQNAELRRATAFEEPLEPGEGRQVLG